MNRLTSRSSAKQQKFSTLHQFLLAAGLTIAVAMIALALAISERMKESVLQIAGQESAALIASVLGPSVQELSRSPRLSSETAARLDAVLKEQLPDRVTKIKIWLRDGTLAYATDKTLVGRRFPSNDLDEAFRGEVSASFDDMNHSENQLDRLLNLPLIEIYAPLYVTGTTDVIAVGEFYSSGERLSEELRRLQFASVAIVGAVTTPMMVLLYLIVRRTNSAIVRHQAALTRKRLEAEELATLNHQLRKSADEARLEAAQINERLLNQIGQDLHDGPIQLLSLLMLKLTESDIGKAAGDEAAGYSCSSASARPHSLTARILKEIRDISSGLVLPQLEGLTLADAVSLAVRQHEYTTGTTVACEIGPLPAGAQQAVRICLFRAVQEGLNNAFHHAGGTNQRVQCTLVDRKIQLTISDGGGQGVWREEESRGRRTSLGLTGIRRRVEALGGEFKITKYGEKGTVITIALPTDEIGG